MNGKILRIKRPVIVSFMGHADQIQEWISYIGVGYLRHETDIPNERVIMNALCRNECATMRT